MFLQFLLKYFMQGSRVTSFRTKDLQMIMADKFICHRNFSSRSKFILILLPHFNMLYSDAEKSVRLYLRFEILFFLRNCLMIAHSSSCSPHCAQPSYAVGDAQKRLRFYYLSSAALQHCFSWQLHTSALSLFHKILTLVKDASMMLRFPP
jgi:hypothetical protein